MDQIKAFNLAMDRLYQRQGDLYQDYAAHYNLSMTAFWLLYTLCETDETYTQNMVADLWRLPRQSINSSVSTLVKAGYIRLEQLTGARNNKALRLTPSGVKFCEQVVFPFFELEDRVSRQLSESERRQFLSLSIKWCDLLQKEIKAALDGTGPEEKP